MEELLPCPFCNQPARPNKVLSLANCDGCEVFDIPMEVWNCRESIKFPNVFENVKEWNAYLAGMRKGKAIAQAAKYRKALEEIKNRCEGDQVGNMSVVKRIASEALKP